MSDHEASREVRDMRCVDMSGNETEIVWCARHLRGWDALRWFEASFEDAISFLGHVAVLHHGRATHRPESGVMSHVTTNLEPMTVRHARSKRDGNSTHTQATSNAAGVTAIVHTHKQHQTQQACRAVCGESDYKRRGDGCAMWPNLIFLHSGCCPSAIKGALAPHEL